ncbi:hypothetical protein DMC47_39550 [Nostoc sp. 3335mG]|nr:hypothetical protein DMC47_39550 [Nostoc sp. 3335mG]
MKIAPWLGACGALLMAGTATAQASPPDWQQLEQAHQQDGGTEGARHEMLAAMPLGTPIDAALRSLTTVGATCKPLRSDPTMRRCLIHQYSLLDGAADDVRWTITLAAPQGRIESLRLDRYVDRHGTA